MGDFDAWKPWKKIYIVNGFDKEAELTCLQKIARDVEIIHVVGRKGATALAKKTYIDLMINRIVSNAKNEEMISNIKRFHGLKVSHRPNIMDNRGFIPIGWNKVIRGVVTAALKSANGRAWPTTGLYAIDLALMENNPKEIYLYGFDFYERPYLTKKNRPYQNQSNPKMKAMKLYMRKLMDEFSETKFYGISNQILAD